MSQHDLTDIYRFLNPTRKRFTWRRTKPVKSARLDYFLASNSLLDLVHNTDILPGYRSDHSIITLTLKPNKFVKGSGIWKLNCSLLRDKNYLDRINSVIQDEKLKYALPVYNIHNIDNISDEEIQFTINDQLFLETLLLRIRGETIKYSSYVKKKNNKKEITLENEIDQLEKDLPYMTDLIQDKKTELQELRNIKLKGQMIRSRVQWIDEGEKPTKFFCSLENNNYTNKTIKQLLKSDNSILTDQKEILEEIKSFYQNLFENKDDELSEINLENTFADYDIKKITNTVSESMNSHFTVNELSNALKNMNNNKTPGIDGFPADFYKTFWSKLKYFVFRSINYCFQNKNLSITMKQTIVNCLPKGNKPRNILKNWRPISLLNVSYKLISSMLAARLKHVLSDIISDTQTGFLQNRFIGDTTRLVYDMMHLTETRNIDGLLVLIDFEKAFDSVS